MKGLNVTKNKKVLAGLTIALMALIVPELAMATTIGNGGGTGGSEFQAFYDFVYGAATGYLGRAVAVVGGLLGLGIGAATGKGLPALIGIFLAVFGVLGPTIINGLFTSALI